MAPLPYSIPPRGHHARGADPLFPLRAESQSMLRQRGSQGSSGWLNTALRHNSMKAMLLIQVLFMVATISVVGTKLMGPEIFSGPQTSAHTVQVRKPEFAINRSLKLVVEESTASEDRPEEHLISDPVIQLPSSASQAEMEVVSAEASKKVHEVKETEQRPADKVEAKKESQDKVEEKSESVPHPSTDRTTKSADVKPKTEKKSEGRRHDEKPAAAAVVGSDSGGSKEKKEASKGKVVAANAGESSNSRKLLHEVEGADVWPKLKVDPDVHGDGGEVVASIEGDGMEIEKEDEEEVKAYEERWSRIVSNARKSQVNDVMGVPRFSFSLFGRS